MTVEWNLSDRDYELLSAYLDGGLAAAERSALEQRLNTEPALKAELVALAETVALLNQLPSRRAPRDFTLTPAMIGRGTTPRRGILYLATSPAFSAVTAAAAVFLVVIGAFLVLQGGSLAVPSQSVPAPVAIQPTDGAIPGGGIALSLTPLEESIVQRGMADTSVASTQVQEQALFAAPLPTQAVEGTPPPSPEPVLTISAPVEMVPPAPSSPSVKASDEGDAAAGALAQSPAISVTNIPQTATPAVSVGEAEAANLQQMPAPTMLPQESVAAAYTETASATPPPTLTAQPTASPTPAAMTDDFAMEGQTSPTGEDGANPPDVLVNEQPALTPAAIPTGLVIVVLGLGLLVVSVLTTFIRRRS